MKPTSFEQFVARLDNSGIATRSSLVGCTQDEIAAIEDRYKVSLPDSYRSYLSTMGHSAGRLLNHDHYAATYQYVLTMTDEFGSDWSDDPTEGRPTLPEDAIVILGRLGADYQMIRCQSPTDSPVWHFDECNPKLRLVHDSVTDWLNALADQAEAAMAEGYYNQYPDGTGP